MILLDCHLFCSSLLFYHHYPSLSLRSLSCCPKNTVWEIDLFPFLAALTNWLCTGQGSLDCSPDHLAIPLLVSKNTISNHGFYQNVSLAYQVQIQAIYSSAMRSQSVSLFTFIASYLGNMNNIIISFGTHRSPQISVRLHSVCDLTFAVNAAVDRYLLPFPRTTHGVFWNI